MILSGTIAGAKWLLQIIAAFIFLKEKKWEFIGRIAFVCFIGSCVLFTYNIMNYLPLSLGGFSQFLFAISLSVITMIFLYYRAVRKTAISMMWFWGWIVSLAIAILLQVTLFSK